jgi:hypothetical protein
MTETADKNDKPPFTHTAWIRKTEFVRKGRRIVRWIDEGVARVEPDGSVNVYLHSLPIGGFDGRICLTAIGTSPPDIMPTPQRPASETDEEPEGDDA